MPRRTKPELTWKADGPVLASSAWPGGPKRLPCLGCDEWFLSEHKGHRLCVGCRHVETRQEAEARRALGRDKKRRYAMAEKGVTT